MLFTKVRTQLLVFNASSISILPWATLVTILQTFVRPDLDYGDVLYNQAFHSAFHEKLESFPYNACLAITGAIKDTSRDQLYPELGLEFLHLRRWCRKLCLFCNILKAHSKVWDNF